MGRKVSRTFDTRDPARTDQNLEPTRRKPIQSVDEPRPTSDSVGVPSIVLSNPDLHKAFLEQLVECTPEATSILDPNQRILHVNREFVRLFGYSAEQTVGQTISSLIVPKHKNSETISLGDALIRGNKVEIATQRARKDGTLVDVHISGAPVIINGVPVALYAIYRDISEQKRAATLSSALYRIAEKTSSAEDLQEFYTAIHGIVGELIYSRNFYIALYDPATQLLSFPYFVDEKDATPPARNLRNGLTEYVLRSGEPLLCSEETFHELKKETQINLVGSASLDWLGVPLKAAGHTFGVVVLQSYTPAERFHEKDRDILALVSQHLAAAIQHKHNAEALKRSEARYRSLVEKAVYGIYCCNFEGEFIDINPALIAMLGYASDQELRSLDPHRDIFVDPSELVHLVKEFRKNTGLHSVEVRWKRKDGHEIIVLLSGRVVETSDTGDEVLEIIAKDVTERRALEDQYRQAQKMEAVGRLAGGVAHDFNNLLMVISGYSEALLDKCSPQGDSFPKLQAIQQAADRASNLTRQLLAFSRKQMLELKVVDVNIIVGEMDGLLRPLIGENIELSFQLASDLGHVRADSGQMEQIIMNLAVNAKDAMPVGGKIVIRTANIEMDSLAIGEHSYIQPGPYVVLSLIDTGCGMDRETQSRIFEPFFTTKEKSKGTGLGLSTVYGIVKQSGGYIVVNSEIGRGTTFDIYFPRVVEAADPIVKPSSTKTQGGSETVLLAEDEESVRRLVRETLEAKGYTVLEAHDGETALRIASDHHGPIDMLITDVVMPGMSGQELSHQICASDPDVKTLYLSGYTEGVVVHEGGLDPGTAFLQKPFTLQTLSRKVREILQSGRPN